MPEQPGGPYNPYENHQWNSMGDYGDEEKRKQQQWMMDLNDPEGKYNEGKSVAAAWLKERERRMSEQNTIGAARPFIDRMQHIEGHDPFQQYSQDARARALQAREEYYNNAGLQGLRDRAGGTNLISDAVMRQQQGEMANRQRSMLASQRGGYNPAAFRQAQMQMGGMGQEMAGQAAAMKAQEMAGAQEGLMNALARGRQDDQAMLGQEQNYEQGLNNFFINKIGMGNQVLGQSIQQQQNQMNDSFMRDQMALLNRQKQEEMDNQKKKDEEAGLMGWIKSGVGMATDIAKFIGSVV